MATSPAYFLAGHLPSVQRPLSAETEFSSFPSGLWLPLGISGISCLPGLIAAPRAGCFLPLLPTTRPAFRLCQVCGPFLWPVLQLQYLQGHRPVGSQPQLPANALESGGSSSYPGSGLPQVSALITLLLATHCVSQLPASLKFWQEKQDQRDWMEGLRTLEDKRSLCCHLPSPQGSGLFEELHPYSVTLTFTHWSIAHGLPFPAICAATSLPGCANGRL